VITQSARRDRFYRFWIKDKEQVEETFEVAWYRRAVRIKKLESLEFKNKKKGDRKVSPF